LHSVSYIANRKKRKKKEGEKKSKIGIYKSIIRKQVKGQNGLDVVLFSSYTERTMSDQLWEKTCYDRLINGHKIRYYI